MLLFSKYRSRIYTVTAAVKVVNDIIDSALFIDLSKAKAEVD